MLNVLVARSDNFFHNFSGLILDFIAGRKSHRKYDVRMPKYAELCAEFDGNVENAISHHNRIVFGEIPET